jgi:hypothetical protein
VLWLCTGGGSTGGDIYGVIFELTLTVSEINVKICSGRIKKLMCCVVTLGKRWPLPATIEGGVSVIHTKV